MCIRVQNDLFMQYMVKRKGLDFTEYGLVDARAVKRQRLGGENTDAGYSPSPATPEHLHVTSATQSTLSVLLSHQTAFPHHDSACNCSLLKM